ncbi:MAG: hypothetical protein B7Z47_07860 [Chthoniobacter sp. 12-60-6]|nr:MAG: hypothetical protein B7Z47_07860 [Chthoniobacter sp. 12-60-6]
MADQARISNLDSIESFRAALIVFINKTRQTLDTVQDNVKKTRAWVQTEQPAYWQQQIRMRQKKLDQAQQELISARNSEFNDNPTVQQMAVRKARAALEEAQAKLDRTKAWGRDFDRTIDPLARKADSLVISTAPLIRWRAKRTPCATISTAISPTPWPTSSKFRKYFRPTTKLRPLLRVRTPDPLTASPLARCQPSATCS